MPVQEEVIPYLLGENNDVVALAQTGTGKTAAFGLPLIQQINVNNRIPQSLILCTGMGHAYPISSMARRISGDTPSSSNVFIKSSVYLYLYISGAKIVLFNG